MPPRARATCIYCRSAEASDAEHVFPASWYPDTTPSEVQRLTVPSCRACNQRWMRTEEALGQELLMVVSPDAPEVAGVHARLARAWQPSAAKSLRDAHHRAGKAKKIFRTMVWVSPTPGQTQTTLRLGSGLLVRASPARRIDKPLLRALAEKLVRGLHFAETGEVLGALSVQAFLDRRPRPTEVQALADILAQLPIDQRLGPGLWYRRYHAPRMSLWAFLLWGQVTLVALVATAPPESAENEAGP